MKDTDARPFPRVVSWSFAHAESETKSKGYPTRATNEEELEREIMEEIMIGGDRYGNTMLRRGVSEDDAPGIGVGGIELTIVREESPGKLATFTLTAMLYTRPRLVCSDPSPAPAKSAALVA